MDDLETLKLQVLALPAEDRATLMEDILASFDPKAQKAIDRAWATEAIDRLKAYDEGKMEAFTMDEVRKSMGDATDNSQRC